MSGKLFTIERCLLALILVLQVAILVWLWTERASKGERAAVASSGRREEVSSSYPTAGERRAMRYPRVAAGSSQGGVFEPFRDANRVFDQMDRMFESAINDFGRVDPVVTLDDGWDALMASPALDMKEHEKSYMVFFSLPGIHPADVEVTLQGRLLTIFTKVRYADALGGHVGTFERAVELPGPVADAHQAEATLTNGILRVSIPKSTGAEVPGKSLKLM